jgi:5S rRNA maturation endonuclease (ribonuclease M5)
MIGIIVEGPYDEKIVRQAAPEARIFVLHGNGFNQRIRDNIKQLLKDCELVFILTDPDKAGNWAATRISRAFPETYRIHVDPLLATKKIYKKIKYGIEYCEVDYIKELIESSIQSRQLYRKDSII